MADTRIELIEGIFKLAWWLLSSPVKWIWRKIKTRRRNGGDLDKVHQN